MTASTNLGAGVNIPAPFALAPGAAAVKTFSFTPGFAGASAGTRSGGFTFTGKAGPTVKARTTVPAYVLVQASPAQTAKLEIKATAAVLSGATGDVFSQAVVVKNIGTVDATGCVANGLDGDLQRAWAAYDPKTRKVTGQPYVPFDIARGKAVNLLVSVRSFRDRFFEPVPNPPFEVRCASAIGYPAPGALDLSNAMNFNAIVKQTTPVSLIGSSPSAGVLSVPKAGTVTTATFRNGSKHISDTDREDRGAVDPPFWRTEALPDRRLPGQRPELEMPDV